MASFRFVLFSKAASGVGVVVIVVVVVINRDYWWVGGDAHFFLRVWGARGVNNFSGGFDFLAGTREGDRQDRKKKEEKDRER